jgi:hypothetical protein
MRQRAAPARRSLREGGSVPPAGAAGCSLSACVTRRARRAQPKNTTKSLWSALVLAVFLVILVLKPWGLLDEPVEQPKRLHYRRSKNPSRSRDRDVAPPHQTRGEARGLLRASRLPTASTASSSSSWSRPRSPSTPAA